MLLPYDQLRSLAEQHGLLATGDDIGPGELRRLLVEADVLPMVLGASPRSSTSAASIAS